MGSYRWGFREVSHDTDGRDEDVDDSFQSPIQPDFPFLAVVIRKTSFGLKTAR